MEKRARSDHAAGHDKSPAAAKPRNQAKVTDKRARRAESVGGADLPKIPKTFCLGRPGKQPRTIARIGIPPGSSRKKIPQLPKRRTTGSRGADTPPRAAASAAGRATARRNESRKGRRKPAGLGALPGGAVVAREPGRSWDGGRVRTSTRAMAKNKKKFYGVKVGRAPGVYDT